MCLSTPFIHVEARKELKWILALAKDGNVAWRFWAFCMVLAVVFLFLPVSQPVFRYPPASIAAATTTGVVLLITGEPITFCSDFETRGLISSTVFIHDRQRSAAHSERTKGGRSACPITILRLRLKSCELCGVLTS